MSQARRPGGRVWGRRGAAGLFGVLLLGATSSALAMDYSIGGLNVNLRGFLTLGAAVRVEDRDTDLIAKGNLNPGLCTRTDWTTTNNAYQGEPQYPGAQGDDIGETCNGTQNPDLNRAYVESPGSFNINGDNGNMNFDRGDIVNAAAKLNTTLIADFADFYLTARTQWLFDSVYSSHTQERFDSTLQPLRQDLPPGAEDQFGSDFIVQDLFLSRVFNIFDRYAEVRVGRHRLNWGESTALVLNSINTVNPPDQRLTRIPGFDLSEPFQGVGMVSLQTELTLNTSMEAYYQYEWRPAIIDAPGTFYSTSDTFGGEDSDGYYAMLSFGKAPEDPRNIYSSEDNPEDPFSLGSASGRTLNRLPDREAPDEGQFGVSLRYYAENLNGGTEFGLYYSKYHSRIPSASFIAAQPSCAGDSVNIVELAVACGVLQGDIGTLRLSGEPLPVDTAGVFAEYPEDIQTYGISFNTTIGGIAWSGEYSFRPNLPVQIHTVDLTFAALQPAFPDNNINLTDLDVLSGTVPVAGDLAGPLLDALQGGLLTPILEAAGQENIVLPGRRIAVPDYVRTLYRDQPYDSSQPGGYYIRGYERLKVGQLATTLIKTIGAANPLQATQIVVIGEAGLTHAVDMPKLSELQFQGPEANTHASAGADGSVNGEISDSAARTDATDTGGNGDEECQRRVFNSDTYGNYEAEPCRQNPTTQDADNFGDPVSYGVRIIGLFKYDNLFWGLNVSPLLGLFYDIEGNAPGLGQNFSEGNLTGLFGVGFDYQQTFSANVRYTLNEGENNARRDRDTLQLNVRYDF